MGIRVEHQPNPAAVGAAAFVAGQGKATERRREQDRAYSLRRQAAQLDAQRLRLAAMAQAQDAQQSWARLGLQSRAQNQDAAQSRARLGLQARDAAFGRNMQVAGLLDDRQQRAMAMQEREQQRQFQWQAQGAQQAEYQVAQIQEQFAKAPLTPQGQRLYGELSGKLRAVQQQRSILRPDQYNNVLGQWLQEFEQSGVKNHIQEPPTAEQELQRRGFQMEDGRFAIMQPDGRLDIKDPPKPEKPPETPAEQKPAAEYFADQKTFDTEFDAAEKRLRAAYATEELKKDKDGLQSRSYYEERAPITDDEVFAEMEKRYAGRQGFVQRMTPPPPPDPIVDRLKAGIASGEVNQEILERLVVDGQVPLESAERAINEFNQEQAQVEQPRPQQRQQGADSLMNHAADLMAGRTEPRGIQPQQAPPDRLSVPPQASPQMAQPQQPPQAVPASPELSNLVQQGKLSPELAAQIAQETAGNAHPALDRAAGLLADQAKPRGIRTPERSQEKLRDKLDLAYGLVQKFAKRNRDLKHHQYGTETPREFIEDGNVPEDLVPEFLVMVKVGDQYAKEDGVDYNAVMRDVYGMDDKQEWNNEATKATATENLQVVRSPGDLRKLQPGQVFVDEKGNSWRKH